MHSNTANKVSTYVPSFQRGNNRMRSALQNRAYWEIYVVDDGSSDKTALIAAQTGVEVIQNSTYGRDSLVRKQFAAQSMN